MAADVEQRLGRLVELSARLMDAFDPDALLHVILDAVTELLSAEGGSIALLDAESGELAFATTVGPVGLGQLRIPRGQGIAGWVAEHGEPVIANDVSQDARFYDAVDRGTGFRTRSILCVPLRIRDRVVGALEALNTSRAGGFTEEDVGFLTAFGGLAATALDRARAVETLRRAHSLVREDLDGRYALVEGASPAWREVVDTARTAAAANATILLLGESGVGKEVVARAIHRWSARAEGPFVAVNCVALTPELLESELFGHEKGAFTGAIAQKKGKFELADGGTIFLDEIGDLAPGLQAKLLRVLQEREFQRVGGVKDIRTNVRVVAATNRDIRAAIQAGTFRKDLFYRLNVVTITLPPLRGRPEDIVPLAERFLARYARELSRTRRLGPDVAPMLRAYAWPGNVRELQNAIERAVVLSKSELLGVRDFPAELRGGAAPSDGAPTAASLAEAVEAFKLARVRAALEAAGGNQTQAASLLGMRQSNLSRLMKSLGLK
ncbi:MAG TPA: sigma 54-interacting transcriptional regulator [Candidatus Binatia bacterium]|nr:sigma 54-interacting transcriptional regulator [Candidatus Binatia bacterium]